jgi:hypothetical protein
MRISRKSTPKTSLDASGKDSTKESLSSSKKSPPAGVSRSSTEPSKTPNKTPIALGNIHVWDGKGPVPSMRL